MRFAGALLLAILVLSSIPSRSAPVCIPFHTGRAGVVEVNCQMQSNPRRILSCVIDTGAQLSMASLSSVSSKSMRGAPVITFQTPGGNQPAYETKQTILLGGIPILATVEVTPQISAIGTDVLIGEDVLSQFQRVSIDYKNHVLTCETELPE